MLPEENNLHASIPPAQLIRMQEAAKAEGVTPDEFLSQAIADRLDARGFEDTLAYGKRRAKERGLKPEDVATAIAKYRQEHAPHEQ